MRQARKKMSITEFEPLAIIGRGAFGEVRVCRQISNGDIVAIKKMRKEDMLNKNQLMHVRTEKEIMTASNPWIVKLKYSFQDELFFIFSNGIFTGWRFDEFINEKRNINRR